MVGAKRLLIALILLVALPAAAQDWQRVRPQGVGLRPAALDLIAVAVQAGGLPETQAILIARHGLLAFEYYANGANAQTLIDGRSMGKTVTALAAGVAMSEGKLKLSDPVLLERKDADVRVRDVLTMSSVLDCDDDASASPGNEYRMYFDLDWAAWAARLPVKRAWGRDGAGLGPFSYCTAGVMLLGGAVEKAVGQPLDTYVQARLFGPLGITTSQCRRSPTGAVMGGGSLALNARDWAKIGQLLLDRGRFGKGQIAPAHWVREMVKPHRIVDTETSYGYLVWRRPLRSACRPVDNVFLMGAGGSGVFILPDRDVVITVLRQDFDQLMMHRRTRAFIESTILPAIPC